jgi:hypothetical protein
MQAKVFQIAEKVKKWDLDLARVTDFRTEQQTAEDAGKIVAAPNISLYCLDDQNREAVFVETPPGLDISQRPFLFITQYENAQRIWTTSYETMHQLAAGMGDRFARLIPMHSVGRCGGTLVSRALNRLGTVLSLDEPDVYNQIVLLRADNGRRDAELVKLIQSASRLLFKPFRPATDTLFLKFRPSCIVIGDLIYKAFPAGRTMFLYRNAETWARSASKSIEKLMESSSRAETSDPFVSLLSRLDISKSSPGDGQPAHRPASDPSPQYAARSVPLLRDYVRRELREKLTGREKLNVLALAMAQHIPGLRSRCQSPADYVQPHLRAIPPMKLLAVLWLSSIQQYLKWHAQGIPMLAVRYETLVADPEGALAAIFQYCGLPPEQALVAEGAFAEDSQKGTPLAWEKVGRATRAPLAPELIAQLRDVLRQYPSVGRPDFIAPGTLELADIATAR